MQKIIGKLRGLRLRLKRASEGGFDFKSKNLWKCKWIMDWWKGISPIVLVSFIYWWKGNSPVILISFIYMFISFILQKINWWKGNNNRNLAIVVYILHFVIFTGLCIMFILKQPRFQHLFLILTKNLAQNWQTFE